jgi:tRNA pseudouridine55 synthase
MVQVAVSGQLLAIAEVERGEIVPRRVFNLTGVTGRAGRKRG